MRPVSLALAGLLLLQGVAPGFAAQQPPGPQLRIVILEGDGAINNIRQRTAREPIVQVEDENRRPVAGAIVLFSLPDRGAGGVFPNGSNTLTVSTNAQGRATATGLKPNSVQGEVQIVVTASYQGLTARAAITQTNALGAAAAAAGGGSGKIIAILAVIGGAAAGGAVAATRGRSTSGSPAAPPPPAPTIVTAGAPTLGPPR